jgi:hypothetical protein
MVAIGQWLISLMRNITAFVNREDDSLDGIRSGYSPLVSPADDAFPFTYHSPFMQGYQPTDTLPPQSPPQSVSGIIPVALDAQNRPILPVSDGFQALAHSLYLLANAGKVSIAAKHQEIEPYIPPAPLLTYDIVMPDEYEVSREEEQSQKIESLPDFDERLIHIVEK